MGGLEAAGVCDEKLNPVVEAAVPPKLNPLLGFVVEDKLVPNAEALVAAVTTPVLEPNPKPETWEADVALVPNPKLLVEEVVAVAPTPNAGFVVEGVANPKLGLATCPDVNEPKLNPEV